MSHTLYLLSKAAIRHHCVLHSPYHTNLRSLQSLFPTHVFTTVHVTHISVSLQSMSHTSEFTTDHVTQICVHYSLCSLQPMSQTSVSLQSVSHTSVAPSRGAAAAGRPSSSRVRLAVCLAVPAATLVMHPAVLATHLPTANKPAH